MSKLVGVGLGVNDPELLTLKAVKALKDADVLCLPQASKENCRAYQIALAAVPELEEKECLCLDFRMIRDPAEKERMHAGLYEQVKTVYEKGLNLVFLTIGDPGVYSTFSYLSERALVDGLSVEVVEGVPSFCSAAAALGISLCLGDDELHIATGQDDLETVLCYSGTKVIMKCGRKMGQLKELLLREESRGAKVYAVSECGAPEEKKYYSAAELPEEANYMTTVIVKGGKPWS